MFSCEFPKFLRTPVFTEHLRQLLPPVEMLRIHVNLLLKFGLEANFSQGVLVCMLLSLFSVDNNVIENIWKRKFTNLMSMHFFSTAVFLQYLQTCLFYKSQPNQYKTIYKLRQKISQIQQVLIFFCKSRLTTNI